MYTAKLYESAQTAVPRGAVVRVQLRGGHTGPHSPGRDWGQV